jgi:hypothetical protein
MVWTAPYGIALCQIEVVAKLQTREPSVEQIIRIGMDTSKHFFQLHGVDAAERPVLRRKLRRVDVLAFFAKLPPAVIGMEDSGPAPNGASRNDEVYFAHAANSSASTNVSRVRVTSGQSRLKSATSRFMSAPLIARSSAASSVN